MPDTIVCKTKRLEYVDFLRGLAMLLVVYGHSSPINLANETLNTFHMPLFFFVSGLCFSMGRGGYFSFLKKKIKGVLVPQLTLGVLLIIESIVFDVLISKRYSLQEVDYCGGFLWWFLLVLFFDYAILYLIVRLFPHKRYLVGVVLFLMLLFFGVSYNKVVYVQQTLVALIYSLIGYILRPYIDKYNESEYIIKGALWWLYVVIAIIMLTQDPMFMYNNHYGIKPLFIGVALIGIFASVDFVCSLKHQKYLSWVGMNSITIYITQFFLLRCIYGISARLPESIRFLNNGLFIFAMVMVCEFGIVLLFNRCVPFLVGRNK